MNYHERVCVCVCVRLRAYRIVCACVCVRLAGCEFAEQMPKKKTLAASFPLLTHAAAFLLSLSLFLSLNLSLSQT